eukprot:scaffold6758_cov116-Isochrysis_galbana.AAC.5
MKKIEADVQAIVDHLKLKVGATWKLKVGATWADAREPRLQKDSVVVNPPRTPHPLTGGDTAPPASLPCNPCTRYIGPFLDIYRDACTYRPREAASSGARHSSCPPPTEVLTVRPVACPSPCLDSFAGGSFFLVGREGVLRARALEGRNFGAALELAALAHDRDVLKGPVDAELVAADARVDLVCEHGRGHNVAVAPRPPPPVSGV